MNATTNRCTRTLRFVLPLLLLTVYSCLCFALNEQPRYYFKHLGIQHGLSQNTVTCIIQDSRGFMWFATKDGVNRYDGIRFRVYSMENSPGHINDAIINTLCEAPDGKIWAGAGRGVAVYDPAYERFTAFDVPTAQGEIITGGVSSIAADHQGNLWIVSSSDEKLFRYSPQSGVLERITTREGNNPQSPATISVDDNNRVWVGCRNAGLYYHDETTGFIRPFEHNTPELRRLDAKAILNQGREMYVGTFNDGLLKLNKETGETTHILKKDSRDNAVHIHTLIRINNNEVWVGSETGLYIYNERSGKITHLQQSYTNPYSLSDNAIYSIYKDKEEGIWLGTYFGGINYLPKQYTPFDKYYPLDTPNTLSGKAVREFSEDEDGNIWIGTEDAGLNIFNPRTKEFRQYKPDEENGLSYHNVHALQIDKDQLWIGTYTGGLDVMNIRTGRVKHYGGNKAPQDVFTMHKDKTGKMWLGGFGGAYAYRKETDSFERVDRIGHHFVYEIKEDYRGNIWFSNISNGVVCYDPITEEVKHYLHSPTDSTSVPTKVIGIFEDSQKRLWFTSEGEGFARFVPETGTFKRYGTAHGLPNNVVYYMTEDHSGRLWFGTNKGLVGFDPQTEEMRVFTVENGLLSNQFNYKSALTAKDGTIYMGTINGFVSFNPERFKTGTTRFTPILTGFQIHNKEVEIGPDSPLKQSISLTRAVKLKHHQNSLSFDISALNYNTPEMYYYSYMLRGVDKEWSILKDNNKITYSNLVPGKYSLVISTPDGQTNECLLNIVIAPPFWQSFYAYMLYFMLLTALLYTLFNITSKRIKNKQAQRMQQLNLEKEKEMYDSKIGFFTNVAHEIRTPVTLIKAPLENILKNTNLEPDTREDLHLMQRNTDRLLLLINQLLDFRKAEAAQFSLTFVKHDVGALINAVYQRFVPALRQKRLNTELHLPPTPLFADVDGEAFTKIISNLLNNASKYSETYIRLELRLQAGGDVFSVVVQNDGNIIPPEDYERVFEAFVQLNAEQKKSEKSGTGIGLSLARSLAELHSGKLELQQHSHRFNSFVLQLPVHQQNVIDMTNPAPREEEEAATPQPTAQTNHRYTVVVAEDNADMQAFVARSLKGSYNVHTAADGEQALQILDATPIDLIITDIVMPGMDGLELLRTVKSNLHYSHIPVILLTARSNMQSKIEGLEQGADAYIEKPFDLDYLMVRIANLLDGRRKIRESFINSPHLHTNSLVLTKADQTFMERINQIIEQNMENADFNVDNLAEMVNTSRSSLLRKIKGITELTVNEYIRVLRLKKAALLLQEGQYRINEICFLTGFRNSSYFAKCFREQFGQLPKDYLASLKEKK